MKVLWIALTVQLKRVAYIYNLVYCIGVVGAEVEVAQTLQRAL